MKIIALIAALCFAGSASATSIIVKDYGDGYQVASTDCTVDTFEVVPGNPAKTKIVASCRFNAYAPLGGVAPPVTGLPRFGTTEIDPFAITGACWLVDFSSSTDTIELECRNWFSAKK